MYNECHLPLTIISHLI
jgi:hypothetical protein